MSHKLEFVATHDKLKLIGQLKLSFLQDCTAIAATLKSEFAHEGKTELIDSIRNRIPDQS